MSNPVLVKGKLADAMPLILAHHYTRRRTADPMHVFLWVLDGRTLATAVFTSPVNRYFGKGAVELARLVRLPDVALPMSRFLAECLRWLKRETELLFCLSYADDTVGHKGYIYQAANFTHVAVSKGNTQWRNDATGQIISGRSFDQSALGRRKGHTRLRTGQKYLYVYPLREKHHALLARFGWVSLPYPKDGVFLT